MSASQKLGGSRAQRLRDLLLVALLALPAALVCALASAALLISGETSPVFRQTRLGQAQRSFVMYKLRTMTRVTEDLPSHEAGSANITTVGRFLRRTKADELPQLLNILRGEMTFVGPRPCLPGQSELIWERQARGVFGVMPGLTGSSQVAGLDMSEPARLAVSEAQYIERQTLISDWWCLVQTFTGRGAGDAAANEP